MKIYNLEERTLQFAIDVRHTLRQLPKSISNIEDMKQVIRSSGSIGANYIEANEKLGMKDLLFRMKIARKEAKETVYWLKIIEAVNSSNEKIKSLKVEAIELQKILSSIINKLKI